MNPFLTAIVARLGESLKFRQTAYAADSSQNPSPRVSDHSAPAMILVEGGLDNEQMFVYNGGEQMS
jgi:hypothetical protein